MLILLSVIVPALILIAWFLTIRMPGPAFSGPLPPLTPTQEALSQRLRRHVLRLAGEIGEATWRSRPPPSELQPI